jgi:hypothetical protein
MKFKIASVLELIVPLSIVLMLSAFLGCGGGGGAYGGPTAYDGSWSINVKGYKVPAPLVLGDTVSCSEYATRIEIAHGYGTVTQYMDCPLAGPGPYSLDVGVTLTPNPAASGIGGTVEAVLTGGAYYTGVCIDRVSCQAANNTNGAGLLMIKCGEAASGC